MLVVLVVVIVGRVDVGCSSWRNSRASGRWLS